MKFFAVKPDNLKLNSIIDQLQNLTDLGVNYLYLRNMLDKDELEIIINAVNNMSIMPIVANQATLNMEGLNFGVHFKNSEISRIQNLNSDYALLTASAHDYGTAVYLLENGVDYVFVSPVFKPLSKQNDNRDLFSRSKIAELIDVFGERVVLLGGINNDRIDELMKNFKNDFSVAGITMYFV